MSARGERQEHRLQDILESEGAECDAPEAHGTLCSLLCLHGAAAAEIWLRDMLPELPAADLLSHERRDALRKVAADTLMDLEDPGFPFTPLLPADREAIEVRTQALAHWAQGFLHGLAEAGIRPRLADKLASEPLAEVVGDLTEISRAVVTDDEDSETDEEAFAELVEYLRVATQLVFFELAGLRADRHEAPNSIQ